MVLHFNFLSAKFEVFVTDRRMCAPFDSLTRSLFFFQQPLTLWVSVRNFMLHDHGVRTEFQVRSGNSFLCCLMMSLYTRSKNNYVPVINHASRWNWGVPTSIVNITTRRRRLISFTLWPLYSQYNLGRKLIGFQEPFRYVVMKEKSLPVVVILSPSWLIPSPLTFYTILYSRTPQNQPAFSLYIEWET